MKFCKHYQIHNHLRAQHKQPPIKDYNVCLCGSVEASVMEGSGRLGNKSRPCFVFETNKFGGKITNMKL